MDGEIEKQEAGTETKANWNEEYDAWLELIEDHLRTIRRTLIIVACISGFIAIPAALVTFILLNGLLAR